MIQQSTLNFLTALSENNNKAWFEANKDVYESAKQNFEEFVAKILTELGEDEPGFKEQKAKDCIFRIYRDVRFGKDKSPYKSNFGAFFAKGGKKYNGAGYYIHLEPEKSFAGGGLWMPAPEVLKAVRQEIDYHFDEFEAVVTEKKFKKLFGQVQGESLKKIPQGYNPENPAAEYLKLKSYTTMHNFDKEAITGKSFEKDCVNLFNTMKPFVDFINRVID